MGFFQAMDISSSGLNAQTVRMNVISSNLANIQTTKTPEGIEYKRKDVVFEAVPFKKYINDPYFENLRKVKIKEIYKDKSGPIKVYNPKHPHADKDGYVNMPNINLMSEMINMITANRSYQANITSFENAKSMAVKSLEIGR